MIYEDAEWELLQESSSLPFVNPLGIIHGLEERLWQERNSMEKWYPYKMYRDQYSGVYKLELQLSKFTPLIYC